MKKRPKDKWLYDVFNLDTKKLRGSVYSVRKGKGWNTRFLRFKRKK